LSLEFITKDKRRLAVVNDLSVEGVLTLDRLASKNRIPEGMMRSVLGSMEEREIIIHLEDGYTLTERGKEVVKELRKLERSSSPRKSGSREGAQVRIAPQHKRKQIDRRRVP